MSTSSRTARTRWRRSAGLLIAGVLLASVGCAGGPSDAEKAENSTLISYAGAANRLSGLEPTEVTEQLRDWARTGLASHLELDTARLRDAAYDTLPVRDSAFADLSRQPTGPGRALFDGRGVLHVLVPRGDPHESRTIGLLIDQHRSDAGADPQQVQVHHYQLHPDTQTIELSPEKPAPSADVRSAHGFVAMRVDEVKGLTDFLTRTRHLSWLEVRGSEVWAGGWNWPDVPAAPLDVEDVSVIQRGYLDPDAERLPGFSLDPGPPVTRDDILAVVPDLRPELADRLIAKNWAGSPFGSAARFAELIDSAVLEDGPLPAVVAELGVPTDRTQLWALSHLLAGRPGYSQARYDGRLEGTKVGMTLFYTDHIAKNWVAGVGTGVPANAVGGFVADPDAANPWSHCAAGVSKLDEYGRLWFGQNDSGFSFVADRVSIGPQATRLFSRTEEKGGTEVEPSFEFGRGLRWWDQHYQAVADYEPQYQRLDQIVRWSGALEWLVAKTPARLPQPPDAGIRSDLRFKDWYAQHNELRERSPIEFVTPPSATQEAIKTTPSKVFKTCGLMGVYGGVSLGDLIQRKGDRSFRADLPAPTLRAGLVDETSRFDPATGAGQIRQVSIDGTGQVVDSLQRTFSTTAGGHAVVDVVAGGRRVIPFGDLKTWLADTAPRKLTTEIAADRGQISESVTFQGQELGRQVVRKYAGPRVDAVTVQWWRGPVDRARRALESIQNRLVTQPAAGLPTAKDGVLYGVQDAGGLTRYKLGGPDAPWLEITKELAPPGEALVFRLGSPDPGLGTAQHFQGKLSSPPVLPPQQWLEMIPAEGDRSVQGRPVGPPPSDAATVALTTPDGRKSTVSRVGDHAVVRADDPVLGLAATPEVAAFLREFPQLAGAVRDAAQAGDGYFRGFSLDGDGVALAKADGVMVAAADHPFAERVQRALGVNRSGPPPLFRLEGGRLLYVDPGPVSLRPGSQRTLLSEISSLPSDGIYLHPALLDSLIAGESGPVIPNPLPRDRNVIVQTAVDTQRADRPADQPDVRVHDGLEWQRLAQSGTGPGGNAVRVPTGQITFVCPDTTEQPVATTEQRSGCEQ